MLKVALQRVHLDCISFIQTHTRTVFLSESFLLLPKDTLITIISDNKVGISTYLLFMEREEGRGRGRGREGEREREGEGERERESRCRGREGWDQ